MADPANPTGPVQLGPPPRRVRLRYGRRFDWVIRRMWLSLVLLTSLTLMVIPLRLTLILRRSELIRGRVDYHQTLSSKGGPYNNMRFIYRLNGREYSDETDTPFSYKKLYPPGAEIAVKTWAAYPELGAIVWENSAWRQRWAWREILGWLGGLGTGSVAGFAALWLAMHQAAQRAVIVRGLAVRGSITRKKKPTRNTGAAVYYQFVAPGTAKSKGATLERAMLLREELTESVRPGQEVTVLYLTDWPQTSVIYPLSFFEAY